MTASTSVALPATAPSPATAALEPLRDLPGLAHACLLDEGGHVLGEIGTDGGTAGAVLAWGRRAGGVASDRGLALEDVIVTSDAAHHLLRAVDGAPSRGSWVYLRVDRERGNLALARRRLAAVASPPAARPTPAAPRPSSSAQRPPGAPVPVPVATPLPSAAPAAPSAPPAAHPMGGTFPRRVPDRSIPAAAPAAIAAPPTTWPTRGPAASPAAVATDPPALPEPRRPVGQAPTTRPAGPVPPADLEHRRSPPQDSAGVLSQRWRTDPETLRRVLAGLLRLGRGTPPAGAPPHGPPPALPGR
ncbi:hypothetical protein [Actinomycetospora callitridis]|uniref:hypothetical protein n=1 Tax=Actinomycetospora callitridis TaxID=913944 RepID=UPI0023664655|nr:hypothetical protein [Actinomycetospora callitridis]MDD7918466.1 hypothetical protein [Actinomycetospora callitridis]